jgi:dTDP-4-amino-4,6-dideoxygalactose transaminase
MRMTKNPSPQEGQLAIEGGVPVRTAPLAPWPHYEKDEIEAVTAVLASGKVNYWTGSITRQFEQDYARHVGTRHAIALANGTVALELALEAIGIGAGDEVITTSRTFIASASCVALRGARPVFADVDPVSQNITAETIRVVLSPRTRAIITVHLAGWPCEMDAIMDLADGLGIKVIEDCAQAHGATYQGRPVGSFGVAGAFSFCQDKIITTGGEGGMLVTNDDEVWRKAWSFKDHGKSHEAVYQRQHPPGFRWLHESFGSNGRMTEMQSAIGRLQLGKLPQWLASRQAHARMLDQGLAGIPGLRFCRPDAETGHAYYRYYAFLDLDRLKAGWDQVRVAEAISAEGIPCYSGSCSEIYREKAFADAGLQPAARLSVAKRLGETSLCFLVHPTLTAADMQDTCKAVEKVMRVVAQP